MAFQPRFQPGDTVIISNPKGDRRDYEGREVTITRYQNDGDSRPYYLSIGLWVGASELTLVKEKLTESGEPLIELLVSEIPKEQNVEVVNINKSVFESQKFKVGDLVIINFFPNTNLHDHFGFNKSLKSIIAESTPYYQRQVGRKGKIKLIDAENCVYRIQYENGGGQDRYPAVCLQPCASDFDPVFYRFQGSGEREVILHKDRVLVGSETFTFEIFDSLLKTINEHKAKSKTGNSRRVHINDRWTGILHDNYLEVGCQQFPYKNIRRLCAAIREVRKLNDK